MSERREWTVLRLLGLGVALCLFLGVGAGVADTSESTQELRPGGVEGFPHDFGSQMAVSGSTMVVGFSYTGSIPPPGDRAYDTIRTYIYDWSGGGWVLTQVIEDTWEVAGSHGTPTVALSGDWLAVGYPEGSHAGLMCGAVHLYQRNGQSWTSGQILVPPQPCGNNTRFGRQMAMSDGRLAILGTSTVRIFELVGGVWSEEDTIAVAADASDADLVFDIELDGNRLAAGVAGDGSTSQDGVGTYLYERGAGGWEGPTILKPSGPDGEQSCRSGNYDSSQLIAIDGSRIVVGCPYANEIPPAQEQYGAVFVFEDLAGGWTETARLTGPVSISRGSDFGAAVDIVGDRILVGAPFLVDFDPDAPIDDFPIGAAFEFTLVNGSWGRVSESFGDATAMRLPTTSAHGWSVAIAGDELIVGDPHYARDGRVSVFGATTGSTDGVLTVVIPTAASEKHPYSVDFLVWGLAPDIPCQDVTISRHMRYLYANGNDSLATAQDVQDISVQPGPTLCLENGQTTVYYENDWEWIEAAGDVDIYAEIILGFYELFPSVGYLLELPDLVDLWIEYLEAKPLAVAQFTLQAPLWASVETTNTETLVQISPNKTAALDVSVWTSTVCFAGGVPFEAVHLAIMLPCLAIAEVYYEIAHDPDMPYDTVSMPIPVLFEPIVPLSAEQTELQNAYGKTLSLLNAFNSALARYDGAVAAGDDYWTAVQAILADRFADEIAETWQTILALHPVVHGDTEPDFDALREYLDSEGGQLHAASLEASIGWQSADGVGLATALAETPAVFDATASDLMPLDPLIRDSLLALDGDLGRFGTFGDDESSIFESDIEWLADQGITKGCNPPSNAMFCPNDYVTRGQMAAFLVRALNLTDDGGGDLFEDDDGNIFESAIDKLATAGITKGCNPKEGNTRFCPHDNVTRGQMAAFLVRAMGYTDDGGGDLFEDDDGNIFESAIDKLATAGVTRGCNPAEGNTKFCPHAYVTRGQMAAFLHRALG